MRGAAARAQLCLPSRFQLAQLWVPAATSQAVPVLPAWGRLLSSGQPPCLAGRRVLPTPLGRQAGSSGLSSGSCHKDVAFCLQAPGSLTEDMEKQIQANSIPVGVLEENARLRSALARLKAAAERGVLKLVPQSQLLSQLSSQRGRQDAGRPSSRGGRDSTGPHETKTRPRRSSQWPQCSQQPAGSHLPEGSQWPAGSQRLAPTATLGRAHLQARDPASRSWLQAWCPGSARQGQREHVLPALTTATCSHHTYGHHK
ncbi:coiled-coil domain-containing protein 157 [Falco peregrinus]|uniref:coiled-coil domain-containing protein 157 n=1 Tax=Falco peregrinus TaxID=8954 RepID=UPI002478C09F|nr:coiled-coil domain-containing protein 157 [Falco peregrinus]